MTPRDRIIDIADFAGCIHPRVSKCLISICMIEHLKMRRKGEKKNDTPLRRITSRAHETREVYIRLVFLKY